jgi:hypothetical protein
MNLDEINSVFKYNSFIQFFLLWWVTWNQSSQFVSERIHFIPTIFRTFILASSKTREYSESQCM